MTQAQDSLPVGFNDVSCPRMTSPSRPVQRPVLGSNPSNCSVATLAGNGSLGVSGDGGLAVNAASQNPASIIFMPRSGDLLLVAEPFHMIRIVFAATGTIARFAGNGSSGFAGDGGPAALAQLQWPSGLAVLRDSTVLIVDWPNNRIRAVSPAGIISTWMGNGTADSSGDGLFRTAARLNGPWKVFSDPVTDDVFVCEHGDQRVRRIHGRTGTVSLLVGPPGSNATVQLSLREAHDLLPIPGSTDVFALSDNYLCQVFLINAASRTAMLLAGSVCAAYSGDGMPATAARFGRPTGLQFHQPSGTLLVADDTNNRIRAFTLGGHIYTIAGNGSASGTGGNIGDGGPPLAAVLASPTSLAWDPLTGALAAGLNQGHRVTFISAPCLPAPSSVRWKLFFLFLRGQSAVCESLIR